MGLVLAIDQGTTGTTCLVVDERLRPLGRGYRELLQRFPRPGWVEHDPEQIFASVLGAAEDALRAADASPHDLAAIGIANQRETTVVWDEHGDPVGPAIVWQDRRTAARCAELPYELIRERTGLVPDPYFSATKLEWILQRARDRERLRFGTVDSWLVHRLAGEHVTDVSNASRTLLLALETLDWDEELLALFGVPRSVLPRIAASSGVLAEAELLGARVPIAGVAGDQQAALFAQGGAKATYGTGSFVLVATGGERAPAPEGLVRTVAWRLDGDEAVYALEGSVFVTGAAIQWLRDGLGLLADAADCEAMAASLASNDDVWFVPALTGLGSPWWRPDARGLITGLTRGTRREHLVRAALEAIAHQTQDVLDAMGAELDVLRADGGAAANAWLMQLQADLAGVPVEVPVERETTALGAAALAGLGAGLWDEPPPLAIERRYEPAGDPAEIARLRAGWRRALERALL